MICQILICILLTASVLLSTFLFCYYHATERDKMPWEKLLMLRTKDILDNYKYVWLLFILASTTVFAVFLLTQDEDSSSSNKEFGNIIISICLSYIAGFIFYQINDFLPNTKKRFEYLNSLNSQLSLIKYVLGEMLIKKTKVPDILVDFEDFIKKYDSSYTPGKKQLSILPPKADALKLTLESVNEIVANIRISYSQFIDVDYVRAINMYLLMTSQLERILRTNNADIINSLFIQLKSFYSITIAYSEEIEPYVTEEE